MDKIHLLFVFNPYIIFTFFKKVNQFSKIFKLAAIVKLWKSNFSFCNMKNFLMHRFWKNKFVFRCKKIVNLKILSKKEKKHADISCFFADNGRLRKLAADWAVAI